MNITTTITAAADYNIDILCLDAPDGHPEKYNKTYKGKNKILPGMLEALGFSVYASSVKSNIHKRTFEAYNQSAAEDPIPTNIANVVFEKEQASEALDKYTFKIRAEGNYNKYSYYKKYKLNFFNDALGQLNEMNIPDEILEPLDKEGFVYFIKLTYTLVLEMPRTKGQIQIGKETIDYETYFDISDIRAGDAKTITKSDVISQGATDKIIPAFISANYTGFIEDASGIIVLVKYNTPETGNIVVYYKFSKQIPRTEKVPILNLSKLNITIENKR